MRIYLISEPDLLQKTLQSFLTDLGHEVISLTNLELQESLERAEGQVPLAIVLSSLEKSFLQAFHRDHPETMLVLWNENGRFLPTTEALAYGVYAFLHPPLHFNELEVLLYRLAQYYTSSDNVRRRRCNV